MSRRVDAAAREALADARQAARSSHRWDVAGQAVAVLACLGTMAYLLLT